MTHAGYKPGAERHSRAYSTCLDATHSGYRDRSYYKIEGRETQRAQRGTHTDRNVEGTPDLQAFRLERDSVEHGSVDHDIVGVVQHICIEGSTGVGLMHYPP